LLDSFTGEAASRPRLPARLDKGKIAQVLIRLKDPKPVYWAYLEKLVRSALDSDPPDPFDVDAQGRETGISPRIEEWARATRQAPPAALENATAVYPAYVVLLGGTEDRRAIPLLNRALLSRDHPIQAEAAEGLALFGDKASIPLILEACRKAPARAAGLIAASLVYFDDAAARAAVDQFLPEKEARDGRRSPARNVLQALEWPPQTSTRRGTPARRASRLRPSGWRSRRQRSASLKRPAPTPRKPPAIATRRRSGNGYWIYDVETIWLLWSFATKSPSADCGSVETS
jgi:hypothetical protein